MNLADSCTFKVFANCSYPTFTVNSTDVNVLVASFKGKNETSDDASNSTLKWAPKSNGKTVATVADDQKSSDCTETRLYVTLTRVQPQNATLSATARLLAASDPAYYQVTMAANHASFFKASLMVIFSAFVAMMTL